MYLSRLSGEHFYDHNTQYPYFDFNPASSGTEHSMISSAIIDLGNTPKHMDPCDALHKALSWAYLVHAG